MNIIRCRITGNVQGVGFRATTKMLSINFHVTGFVSNLPDGSVEIVVQGEAKEIERFLLRVKKEFASHIEEIKTFSENSSKEYLDFSIL